VERISYEGASEGVSSSSLAEHRVTWDDGAQAFRVTAFPSTLAALPPIAGHRYTNTETTTPERPPASARVHIEFDPTAWTVGLASPPYDPFIVVEPTGRNLDVHLPRQRSFPDAHSGIAREAGDGSFRDDAGFPWALLVPSDWRHPLERVQVGGAAGAYTDFSDWRESAGALAPDWYDRPLEPRVVSQPRSHLLRRAWALQAGGL